MCTVTFIPYKDRIYITSNRDEKQTRPGAAIPSSYEVNGAIFLYPKDAKAGGTWIALNNTGMAAVLLNGAFVKHVAQEKYRRSRGLIFLDIFQSENPLQNFLDIDLDNIEPFTMIIYNNELRECRWDGMEKYSRALAKDQTAIWSSCTLYERAVVEKREQWFRDFLQANPNPTQQDIIHFHKFTGDGDKGNDLLMNRDGVLATVSISSVLIAPSQSEMEYHDLKNAIIHKERLTTISHRETQALKNL